MTWFGLILLILLLLAGSSQAQQQSSSNEKAADDNMLLLQQQLSFADVLTQNLYKNPNECTSAWGISMCFGLIYPSSTGDAQKDLQNVFGYPPLTQKTTTTTTTTTKSSDQQPPMVWTDLASRLMGQYQGECLDGGDHTDNECYGSHAPLLQIANRVWVRNNITLNETYAAILKDYLHQLDFAQDDAGEKVNEWVKNTTNGLIDSIVDNGPLDPLWILLAVNSLYLKVSWATQFTDQRTNEDLFYSSPSRKTTLDSKARFMHIVGSFHYSDTALPGYQLLRLAFAGTDSLSMVFVLPLADGNPAVAATQLVPALDNLASTSVAVALPKFRFESEYSDSLLKALQASGLVAPFSGGLCVEQDSCDNFVDYVIQKTLMDVNEMGIEAAAVTAVAVGRGRPAEDEDAAPPVLFMADHPMQFFVIESNNNNNDNAEAEAEGSKNNEPLILFEGRVGSPVVAQDAPAVLFEALHSDADFWINNFGAEPTVVEPVVVEKSDTTSTGGQNQEGTSTGNQNQETTTTGDQNQEVTTTDNQNQAAPPTTNNQNQETTTATDSQNQGTTSTTTTTTTGSQDSDTTKEKQNETPKDESSQGPPVSLAVGTPCPIVVVMMAGLVAAVLF